ncbi:hypothetical protein M440DRAFT_148333 [Trichoderma longibrachiatum ATCC 18648]|uniref:Uncharacterized protein n=1 Tax=Trichoderma longibrachiatum ATCC 18648 TaxID=983965 RepID=A0A2T4BTP6_TRILO|nr:hypothetical protein M440DRAFT_148333 [Trichoderma longibrachiatum ATCC 18648]
MIFLNAFVTSIYAAGCAPAKTMGNKNKENENPESRFQPFLPHELSLMQTPFHPAMYMYQSPEALLSINSSRSLVWHVIHGAANPILLRFYRLALQFFFFCFFFLRQFPVSFILSMPGIRCSMIHPLWAHVHASGKRTR